MLDRLAPIVAGLAGLGWFWAELAPQRAGFPDTDNPAQGLRFVAAHPEGWTLAGITLAVAALALAATVLGRHRDLVRRPLNPDRPSIAPGFATFVGLLSASLLLAMAILRLVVGPLLYVRSLDQGWGEAAYLVTQFVGVQLLALGGVLLLPLWIVSVAWLGVRRGLVPRPLAWLAILPAFRLTAVLGQFTSLPDGLWPLYMAAIPAAWIWLILFGIFAAAPRRTAVVATRSAARVEPDPAPSDEAGWLRGGTM